MSASSYPTCSIILPVLTRILEVLVIFEIRNGNKFINEMALNMYDDLKIRTEIYINSEHLICATFMDPRYRSLKFIKDTNERDKKMFVAKSYLKTLFLNEYKDLKQVKEPPAKNRELKQLFLSCVLNQKNLT